MKSTDFNLKILMLALAVGTSSHGLHAQSHEMDTTKSSLTIRVFKSGVFSAFAHDHEIHAPIENGAIDSSASPAVHLRVDARKLRVLDPEIDADKRAEIQRTMEGTTVLDGEHYPDISFQSASVTKTGDDRWEVHGTLELHGKKQPLDVAVSLEAGRYLGSAAFKQSAFGITPIRIAGGTVKVKDEIKIEFEIFPLP
jgi:polyisoprenoid-binding protein YceI